MSATTKYDETAATLRRAAEATERDVRELVRLASLAASSHNTQPWVFTITPDAIAIRPDLDRRCPAVDPDDAHLYKSLGCATENLVQAATTQGIEPIVSVAPTDGTVTITVDQHAAARSNPLAAAILTRQCTRASYDGTPVASDQLTDLQQAGTLESARCLLFTEPEQRDDIAAFVAKGNLTQLSDAAFRQELVSWIRFNPTAALSTCDGLAGRTTGQPSVPTWLGTAMQRVLLKADKQAELDTNRLATSAGVALFVTPGNELTDWINAGRAYQRFALQAEVFDIRTAFINQPIEVSALRSEFEAWMGLSGEQAQLAVRFGHGPKMPYSLRRSVDAIVATTRN